MACTRGAERGGRTSLIALEVGPSCCLRRHRLTRCRSICRRSQSSANAASSGGAELRGRTRAWLPRRRIPCSVTWSSCGFDRCPALVRQDRARRPRPGARGRPHGPAGPPGHHGCWASRRFAAARMTIRTRQKRRTVRRGEGGCAAAGQGRITGVGSTFSHANTDYPPVITTRGFLPAGVSRYLNGVDLNGCASEMAIRLATVIDSSQILL